MSRESPLGASRLEAVLTAALIVMGGFVASRLLGLIRNVVISHQYGASREYETFVAAISVPDMVFQVLAGGAVAAAFIPVFTSYVSAADYARAWRLTSALINLAVVGIGAAALLLAAVAPAIMAVVVAGWSPGDQAEAAHVTRLMMITPVIFAVSTLVTSVLNGLKRFAITAAAPLMYNLSLIVGAVALRPLGVEGLAISAVIGALLHLAVQVPALVRLGMRYSPTLGLDLEGTREVGRLMIPRVLGLGVGQFNQLANVALASFLVEGSIAYLNYAWLILMVPLGVFAMAVSTAVFPTLAEQAANHDASGLEEERVTFLFVLRLILYLTIPATVGLIVLGRPIVGVLLERGAFDAPAATATAFALAWYAVGLPGHAVIEIVDRVFYAQRDTATPVRVAAIAVVLNVVLSVALMRTELSFGGLALANAIAALTEAIVLTALLHRRVGWVRPREFVGFAWRIGLAAVTMGVAAMLLQGVIGAHVNVVHGAGQLVLVAVVAPLSVLAYLGLSVALGAEDGKRALELLRHRP